MGRIDVFDKIAAGKQKKEKNMVIKEIFFT